MKILAGLAVVALIALGAGAVWYVDPWGGSDDDAVDLSELTDEFQGSSCRQTAGLAAGLALQDPELTPTEFLRAFGRQVAGIRPPPRAFGDLARGGSNQVPGKGFLARFDDGTIGQARHFAGVTAAASFGGAQATRLISIFARRDPLSSPDGQLTEEGIAFAQAVQARELELDETPEWLLDHLCRRRP
ncbi:MAG: hypothetical protein M3O25_08515 [Actinomycetota bacterium]|nr:hypothetical protein [Actinomycetota bacterium]